jgi:hypothetical protein
MSINNLEVFGNIPITRNGRMFTQQDADLLESKTGRNKIRQKFSKTPFKFNLYITPECTQYEFSRKEAARFGLTIEDDAINCIYRTNVTSVSNYIPMTGWILAHRIGHLVQASKFNHLQSLVMDPVDQLMADITVLPKGKVDAIASCSDMGMAVLSTAMTMRSARDVQISNSLDFFGELMAQYIVTGKITLLRYADWQERWDAMIAIMENPKYAYSELTRRCENAFRLRDIVQKKIELNIFVADYIDAKIEECEAELNKQMHNCLTRLVGQTFCF